MGVLRIWFFRVSSSRLCFWESAGRLGVEELRDHFLHGYGVTGFRSMASIAYKSNSVH